MPVIPISVSTDDTLNLRVRLRGVELNVRTAGEGPAIVFLHGFTGSSATWDSHVAVFERCMKTIAIDLVGHGDSDTPADPENYRMESCIEHLLVILDELGMESVNLVGYSMGGRVALHLATAAPDRVRSMILESSSPGIADPIERQKRVAADNLLADYIERKGVDAFVDRWESLPLFESQRNLPAAVRAALRAQRLQNNPVGLANSLRGMGAGRQESLWHRLSSIETPVLLIAGQLDVKYCRIAREMMSLLPNAKLAVLDNAGHAVHLERPAAFDREVLEFLAPTTM